MTVQRAQQWVHVAAVLVSWTSVTCIHRANEATALWSSLNPPSITSGTAVAKSFEPTAALSEISGLPKVGKRDVVGYVSKEPPLPLIEEVALVIPSKLSSANKISPEELLYSPPLEATGLFTFQEQFVNVDSLAHPDGTRPPIAVETNIALVTAAGPTQLQSSSPNSEVSVPDTSFISSSRVIVDELTQETLSPEDQVSLFYSYINDLTASNIRVSSDIDVSGTKTTDLDFIGSAFSTELSTQLKYLPPLSDSLQLQPSTLTVDTKPFGPTRNLKFP